MRAPDRRRQATRGRAGAGAGSIQSDSGRTPQLTELREVLHKLMASHSTRTTPPSRRCSRPSSESWLLLLLLAAAPQSAREAVAGRGVSSRGNEDSCSYRKETEQNRTKQQNNKRETNKDKEQTRVEEEDGADSERAKLRRRRQQQQQPALGAWPGAAPRWRGGC